MTSNSSHQLPVELGDVTPSELARHAFALMGDLVLDNDRRREVASATGLPFGRIRALRRIAAHPRTMGELAALLGIDAPYATSVVDELEAMGLVERHPHPTDRRAKVVAVTSAGGATAAEADAILSRPPAGVAALTPEELVTLVTLLRSCQGDRSEV